MAWIWDKPLVTTSSAAQNEIDKKLWESEDLGGMTEDNNRMPVPVVILVFITVITAFLTTIPLWGQRPTAAIYADYVKTMDTPQFQAIQGDGDAAAMKHILEMNPGGPFSGQRDRHPVTMDDLHVLKPQIDALVAKGGVDLLDYTVVGPVVKIANFEGNFRADGTRIRQQPWWDKGFTIDVFYLIMFFVGVTLVIKRLPPSSWSPRHGDEH